MEMMGIINVTPDSFYAGSRVSGAEEALKTADRMIAEGAKILDIGGESTRPGSDPVSEEQEIERVVPVIRKIREHYPDILLSVDTYRSGTAEASLKAGCDIINDISALTFDPRMADVAAEYAAPVILMHIKGTPDHMQDDPHYDDVVREVHEFLERQISYAISKGITDDRIVIDLGIGFGKNDTHNLSLLRHIRAFDDLGMPHLLAVSRKSFIGRTLGEKDPADRLYGTTAVTAYAATNGIELARVHDVKPNLDAARIIEAVMG